MSHLEVHHDLAIRLLVGRSIPEGIPWTLEEDQRLVDQERIVWDLLSPEDQQWEQEFLADLWRSKGDNRQLPVNPAWGDWKKDVPERVAIVDDAFGSPARAYRPDPRGRMFEGDPWCDWLWSMGFRVATRTPDKAGGLGGSAQITLTVPATRVLQEADRLLVLLRKHHPKLVYAPFRDPSGGTQILSSYDPVQRRTYLVFQPS